MCCRLTCVFYIDLLCSFMLSNYDKFANYIGTNNPNGSNNYNSEGTNVAEGTIHKKGTYYRDDMKLIIKKVRILLLRLGIGYLINIACFLIVCFVNRKTKDEGEGGFLLFCSIVIFTVCFYAFITFSLVYRISRFSNNADNSKAEYKVSKYQKFMMVYKCLDVIFDIAVLLYSFILSDGQLTAFTTPATAVLCTDIVLNVIVVMKNCCSEEEKSNTYRSSETNEAFEPREIKEDGSNAIHHGYAYREESVSREESDLERLPPQSVSLSDTRVNRRPYTETDHQLKTSRSVSYEVHAGSKGEEEQKLEKHPPNTLQGCEHRDKQSTNDNLLQQTSSYQGMHTDRHDQFNRRRDPQDGIPQKFSDSYDHNDEFELRKTTDNTEIYNKSKNDRPPPYSTVVKDTNNTGYNVSEEINQEKCKEKYESKKNNENKKSDLKRDNLYSLESRPNKQADYSDEKCKEKYESKKNDENKKSDLERDNLYSIESRPNRQADDPDENCKEKYESKRNNENKKSDLERDNLYSLESRPTNRQADNPDEKFKEKYESKRSNETKISDLERDNLYSLESRLTNRQADDPDEENQEEHEQKTCIVTRKSNIESSNRYSKDHKGPQTSVDVQEEDFPEENIPASTNEIPKSNIEDNNRYSIEPRRPQNGVDVQEEVIHEEHISASPNEMETIEDSSEYCEPMEIENSSDDVQETVATSDFNSSSDWVEPEENIRDAVTKSHIEDCEV